MNNGNKIALLNKYRSGTLTEQEEMEFFSWYETVSAEEFHQQLQAASGPVLYEEASPAFLEQLRRRLQEQDRAKVRRMRVWWPAAAAAVLAAILVFTLRPGTPKKELAGKADVAPGHSGAMLTLADGKQITLDSMGNGILANQNGTTVIMQNGGLSYDAGKASGIAYNTVSTPRARQFRLTLPDGSQVWLNAASAIRYPTAFTGNERKVEVKGEAYFEVAKDAAKPFLVQINNQATLEVLGTHFNINAYDDETNIRATLLEGSVKISLRTEAAILQPGQQAEVNSNIKINNQVNTAQVVAWKEGTFNFDQLGIAEVMRQLSRWYNIEVVYEGAIPTRKFYGEIGRNLSLSQVLEGLKASGVNFRIEAGNRLVVLP